jgi:uncharacterized membrane protein (DUF485 family)
MMYVVGHSLALLVLLAGLFLLAYAKKEGLGWLTKISSFVAITFGIVVFVGGIVCGIICGGCHKSACGDKGGKCSMEMSKDCSGSSCSTKMHHGGMKGDCSKSSCCSAEMNHHGMKEGKCCDMGDKECKMEGTEKEVKIEKKVIVEQDK